MEAKTTIVSDIRELVVNGDFSAWTTDNPDLWIVVGESLPNEVSEVGTGEGHGGTGNGCCNIYRSAGFLAVGIRQVITLVVGKTYRLSINIDTKTAGIIVVSDDIGHMAVNLIESSTGVKTITFVATGTSMGLRITNYGMGLCDVTIDDISVKQVRK